MTTWRRYPRFDPQNSTSLVRKLPLELSLLRDDMTTWQRHPRFDPKISTSHLGDFPLEWSLLLDDMTTWQRHPRFKFNIVCWKLSFGGCLLLDDMSTWQRHPRFDPQNSTSLVGNMIFWNGLSEKATKSCTPMPTTTFSSVGRAFEVLQALFQGKTRPQADQRMLQHATKSCTPMPTTTFSWVGRAFGHLQVQNREPLRRSRGAFKKS